MFPCLWLDKMCNLSKSLEIIRLLLPFTECGLAGLFTLNAAFDLLRYLGSTLSAVTVELTPKQKRLLGVKESGMVT